MYYLAYGSNLHPLRLLDRVPNVRFVGTTKLDGYQLTFHKRSTDGSSKCNLVHTSRPSDVAYGAVYFIPDNEVHLLDAAEGLGKGYTKLQLAVSVAEETINVFTYFASSTHLVPNLEPYHWYKGFVMAGAYKHQFPADYIASISAVSSKQDPDEERRIKNEALLAQLEG